MDEDTATRFVSSLVKSIQALCNGYIDFSSSIEVIGHIHLNIDRNKKLDYVLTEEVSKSVSEGATVFASHSYHSHPPPSLSSKNAGDASNQNRRKSQVTQDDDPLGISSLPPDVSRTHSSGRVDENSDSSQSGSANFLQNSAAVKTEPNRAACQVQEGLDRRRKGVPLSQKTQSPAAKRPRNNDSSSSAAAHTPGFDVIEIKEEPDDEPSVYFGDSSSSHVAPGQDIQTPDFSNVVMESLDRVGQIEGTQLVSGGESMQQQQPFPVMLHANSGIPASSTPSQVPGPSLNPHSTASASGVLSEAEFRIRLRRQRNAIHARTYRQRVKQSEEKLQRIRERAKVRQRRYLKRQKEMRAVWEATSPGWQDVHHLDTDLHYNVRPDSHFSQAPRLEEGSQLSEGGVLRLKGFPETSQSSAR